MTDTVSAGEEVTALNEDGMISDTRFTKHATAPVMTASHSTSRKDDTSPSAVATAVTVPHKSSDTSAISG